MTASDDREVSASAAFREMLLVRRFEEECARLTSDTSWQGVLHVGARQEAVPVGVALARRRGDLLFSTHRGLGHCVAWGADLVKLLAETLGRRGGFAKGLAGHMHIADWSANIACTNGIVGAGLPLAVGAAVAADLLHDGQCVVAFLGDGAINTGACHEALNLAGIWSAPVLFVCENNGLAEMTYSRSVTAGTPAARVASYGIPVETVNGNDVGAVHRAAHALMVAIRSGRGPGFLECRVHRASGHWVGDPEHYRDEDEEAAREQGDPLDLVVARGALTEEERSQIIADVESRLESAIGRVMAMPSATPNDVACWGVY